MVEGTQVGAYKLIQRIGEGGMGVVWLAEHTRLGRRAAVKVLHPSFSMQPAIVQRFFNEARAATAISDPGIVQIFDFGNHTDGSAYIVMELLEGEALDNRARREPMPVGEALRILRQVSGSLGAAHARGIVHRDLKPENIFLVRDPEVPGGIRAKILDFGIAKLTGDSSVAKTNTQAVMGTPQYMSPEQCRGAGHVDARSDIYALGCVLMTLLTGRPPFDGEGIGELIVGHMQMPPPAPSSRVPTVPPAVDQLVLRCLAKDPAHRYANGAELANALGALVTQPILETGQRPAVMAATIMAGATPQPTTLSSVAVGSTVVPPAKKTGLVFAGLAVVVVGGIGIGTVIVLKSASSPAEPTPAAAPPPAPAVAHTAVATPQPAPQPAPQPPPVDERPAKTKTQIASAVQAFPAWAASHGGAACPKLEDVAGHAIDDGWGHPLVVTCTGQPADQIVGIFSAGPDGAPNTGDDIGSWDLDKSITDTIRGARWTPKAVATTSRPKSQPKPKTGTKPKPTTGVPGDLDGDGLPDVR